MWVSLMLMPVLLHGANTKPWIKKAETKDGIIVHARPVPGSDIREVKATCRISAAPLNVYKVAMDPATYEDISEYIETTQIIPSGEKDTWYIYQRLDLPLINDRDYTLRYMSIEHPEKLTYQIRWQAATNKGPAPIKDVIRVSICDGSITILPENNGTSTTITYALHTDPGGYIPDWLVNIANQRSIPRLLRAIKDRSVPARKK